MEVALNPPTSQVPLPAGLPPACQIGWFVSPAGEAFRALCNKLTCPTCAPRKLRRYRERLGRVTWSKMLTLTMPPDPAPLDVSIARQAASWRVLHRWLKRNANLKEYTWARECTKLDTDRPNLHMHVIMNSDYVPTSISKRGHKSLLNDAIVRAGFGSVFDIKKIRGTGANHYVTKYVSKCDQRLPRYTRRLQSNVPDLRPKESGWHYVSNASWGTAGRVLDVCAHGARSGSCAQCSERSAERAGFRGDQLALNLNSISPMKKCVTREGSGALPAWFQVWMATQDGGGGPERGN